MHRSLCAILVLTSFAIFVSAISGLVAEVTQQMETGAQHAPTQQRQEVLDNIRPYTNGTVIHSGPVHIVASEYKEKSLEPLKQREATPVIKEEIESKEVFPEKDINDKTQELIEEEASQNIKEPTPEPEIIYTNVLKDSEQSNITTEIEQSIEEVEPITNYVINTETENLDDKVESIVGELIKESEEMIAELNALPNQEESENNKEDNVELIKLSEWIEPEINEVTKSEEFLDMERKGDEQMSTEDLIEEAIRDLSEEEVVGDKENQSVKVMGMEVTAHAADGSSCKPEPPKAPVTPAPKTHEAEEVQSIFLQTEIPQQSRVLVADFAEERPRQESRTQSPLVVSGKITLSLIQDGPRDTPDRDLESTVDEFTTASALTQPAAEKEDGLEESDEEIEIEEEIEVEEIEEEVEEEEVEEGEIEEIKKGAQKK